MDDIVNRVGNQRQRCAQFMADIGKELQLGCNSFFLYPMPCNDGSVDVDHDTHEQQDDDAEQGDVDLLVVILCQIVIHLAMQRLEPCCLLHDFLILKEQGIGIIARHKCAFQVVVTLVGLLFQDVQCQLHDEVATGWIDIGSHQPAVTHALHTTTGNGKGINTDKLQVLHPMLLRCLQGTDSHTVILCKDIINLHVLPEHAVHNGFATILQPVGITTVYNPNIGISLHGVRKATVTLNGRRGPLQSAYLNNVSFTTKLLRYELSHLVPSLIVISSHKGSVLPGISLAVEKNYGNTGIVSLVDDR